MDQYVTGKIIKTYREKKNITQKQLAEKLFISSKTVSKWETGNGFPDISIIPDLAQALEISVSELFIGDYKENKNIHSNMLLTGFYVCPVCSNIITSTGDMFASCHGINLVKEEAVLKEINMEKIEDEIYVSIDSPMTKTDYVLFVAGIYSDSVFVIKLYPEQMAEARLKRRGLRKVYYYSKREGLFYGNINIK